MKCLHYKSCLHYKGCLHHIFTTKPIKEAAYPCINPEQAHYVARANSNSMLIIKEICMS